MRTSTRVSGQTDFKRYCGSVLCALILTMLVCIPCNGRTMNENPEYLIRSRACITAFDSSREPERLREAYMALENVDPDLEQSQPAKAQIRAAALGIWLTLLDILDRGIDPAFDVDKTPQKTVAPPTAPGQPALRPGSDPALVRDETPRKQYEAAIEANRNYSKYYRFQLLLGRLNEPVTTRAQAFILKHYATSTPDRAEYSGLVAKLISNPARNSALLKLLGIQKPVD